MDILMRYGFSIEEIKNMMDANDELENVPDNNILEIINILISIGCHEEHIMNIFNCNPFILNRNTSEIKKLINKLKELELKHLYMIFDINPHMLNMNANDIDKIYNDKITEGLDKEDIIDYFYHNIIL